eukprot:Nitzschia sp. Nitz4//scaffold60_size111251//101942//103231//NITZ4_004164-RA/size111251-processed-gene-0.44-mRNA-1//-1//CDS//3329555615//1760//frame0
MADTTTNGNNPKTDDEPASNSNSKIMIGVGCLLVIIAVVVGLVVGLNANSSWEDLAATYDGLISNLDLNPASSDEDIEAAIKIMAEHYSQVCVGGSVMAVSRPSGRIIVSDGVLDVEDEKNATLSESTVFEIGSVSKTFTGLELARQISAGMITLDTTVNSLLPEYVPDMIVQDEYVTLKHLVTHTAGLPNSPGSVDWDVDFTKVLLFANFTEEDLLQDLVTAVEEGLDQNGISIYSNFGFNLLGYILGKNANSTFPEIQQEMTDRLGMEHTYIGHFPNSMKAELATGYMFGTTEAPYWYDSGIYIDGAGSTLSTINDLLQYVEAFMDPEMSFAANSTTSDNEDILAALTLSQEPLFAVSDDSGLAYAWFYGYSESSNIYYKHSGSTVGFSSHVAFQPSSQTAVVAITNCGYIADIYSMGDVLLAKILE